MVWREMRLFFIRGVMIVDSHRHLLFIFLAAILLRMGLFLLIGPWKAEVVINKLLVSDAAGYHRIAVNLLDHQTFSASSKSPYESDTTRTPGYPFFLAVIYAMVGQRPFIAIFVQTIIGAFTCLLLYKIAATLFNKKIAVAAGWLLAFEYTNVIHTNLLLSETMFLFIFCSSIFFLARFITTKDNKDVTLAAILLGLATLCRPVSVYLVIFLIVVFCFRFRSNLMIGMRKYALFAFVFFLTIAPWMVRNYVVSDSFTISYHQRAVIRWNMKHVSVLLRASKDPRPLASGVDLNANTKMNDMEKLNPRTSLLNKMAQAVVLDTKKYISGAIHFFMLPGSNKLLELLDLPVYRLANINTNKGLLEKVTVLTRNRSVGSLAWLCFCTVYLLVLYMTAGLGFFTLYRSERVKFVLLMVIIFYFTIASAPFSFTDRYRLPIMPFVIIFSIHGAFFLQRILLEKLRR